MKQLCLKYFRICWGRENNYLLSLIFIVIAITKILIIATPIIFGKLIDGLSTQDKSSLLLDSPLLLALIYGLSWLFAKIAQVIQELLFSTLYQKLFRKNSKTRIKCL